VVSHRFDKPRNQPVSGESSRDSSHTHEILRLLRPSQISGSRLGGDGTPTKPSLVDGRALIRRDLEARIDCLAANSSIDLREQLQDGEIACTIVDFGSSQPLWADPDQVEDELLLVGEKERHLSQIRCGLDHVRDQRMGAQQRGSPHMQ